MPKAHRDALIIEENIQKQIVECLDNYDSFYFDAGAGAGKTYSLISSLEYLLESKFESLASNSRHVLCITYTNAAADEVHERLGASEIVMVSTIHERCWDIVRPHRAALLECHKSKLHQELEELSRTLKETTKVVFSRYLNLTEEQQKAFAEFFIENKREYYDIRNVATKSKSFNVAIKSLIAQSVHLQFVEGLGLLSNYKDFQSLVGNVLKQASYRKCLQKIADGVLTSVEYNANRSSDQLARMEFSHDTLLEYFEAMVKKYPVLRQIIIDKFPYVLVDEYQDTNPMIVQALAHISRHAIDYERNWLVGYFGDSAQNIFDTGVGAQLLKYHEGLCPIKKEINRRSHTQIIELINKVRDDDLQQLSISDNKSSGSCEFYINSNDEFDAKHAEMFLQKFRKEIITPEQEQSIHCLVLTNKLMAKLNGFEDVHTIIDKVSNIKWDEVGTKLLSTDYDKLDPNIQYLFLLLRLRNRLQNKRASYADIFGTSVKSLLIKDANAVIHSFRDLKVNTLRELIEEFSARLPLEQEESAIDACLKQSLNIESNRSTEFSNLEEFYRNILRKLVTKRLFAEPANAEHHGDGSGVEDATASGDILNLDEGNQDKIQLDALEQENDKIDKILQLDLVQLEKWAAYIDGTLEADNVFHTYHSAKGREYDNVAIFLQHNFGTGGKTKFKNLFEAYGALGSGKKFGDLDDEKLINSRNLLYVACSRAKNHLRVLYNANKDDFRERSAFYEGLVRVFGKFIILTKPFEGPE